MCDAHLDGVQAGTTRSHVCPCHGGLFVEVIEKTTRNGQLVYEFTFTEPDTTPKLYVSEDGTVLPEPTKAQQ